jgi:hypothetical protein
MITNDHHALHRKNQKNKSDMQASQEMVNAFDKISVSVRRAYNVNRSQQDHLYNKVSTIENEHRKSMGLLAHQQKQFIRARKKFSNIPLKSEQKHRKRHLSTFSLPSEKDSIKTASRLPSLVNRRRFEDGDSVETFKRHALNREIFVGSKRRNLAQRPQDLNKRFHLPSIQEAQLNTAGQYTETNSAIGLERDPSDKRISRITGNRRDIIDKQQYVASWDISGSEERSKRIRKSYNDLDKTPLVPNSQLRTDESTSTKPKAYAHCNDDTIAQYPDEDSITAFERSVDIKNQSPSLSNKKYHLVRNGTNTSDLESILDKTTEIRVKQFLKLPRIGGIHENQLKEQPDTDSKDLQPPSIDTKRSSHVNQLYLDGSQGRQRAKSSLWKNLVHCRYLRLGEDRVHQHRVTNKNCECNWCAMMKKSRV